MLKERISKDMKEAVKRRDRATVDTLRMVLAAIKNREIEKRREIDEEETISLITGLVKQRREAADMYRKGGRSELADKEEAEIGLLKAYLPEEMSREELAGIIDAAIKEVEASTTSDMGKVMKVVMSKVAGRAEGRVVSEIVKAKLSN